MGSELGIWKDRSKGKDRDEERSEARKVAANQKHCYWKKEAKKRSEARKVAAGQRRRFGKRI